MHQALRLLAVVTLLWSARVRAEEAVSAESANLSAKLMLGIVDTVDAVSSASVAPNSAISEAAYGFAAQYTAPLPGSFALGAAVGYLSWRAGKSLATSPRNWLVDFAVLPEGRVKLTNGASVYVTVPLGVSLDVLKESETELPADRPSDRALGFLIGGLIGARVPIADRIGLFGELGYVYRNYFHKLPVVTTNSFGLPIEQRQNVTIVFGHLALNIGACVFF